MSAYRFNIRVITSKPAEAGVMPGIQHTANVRLI